MDNISREAAIEALGKKRYFGEPYTDHEVSYNTAIEDAIAALSALPAVDSGRVAELEAALVQAAIPMEALLTAEASFPFLAPTTITRLESALRLIEELLPLPAPPIE